MVAATKKTRRVAYVAVPAGGGASPPAIFVPAEDAPKDERRGMAPSCRALLLAAVAVAALLLLAWAPMRILMGCEGGRGAELLEAAYRDDDAAALRLIATGADVNFRAAKNKGGQTPLHIASRDGRVDVVEALVVHGADVDARNERGRTPLSMASIWGRVDVVAALLAHGADVNLEDRWGQTPLYFASMSGHADVMELLKGAGGV